MRVLVVVHQEDAGPGVFRDVLDERAAETVEWRPAAEAPPDGPFDAVVVLGGAAHPHQLERHPWLGEEKRALGRWLREGLPVLGVCLGAELVAEALGGSVVRLPSAPEIGWFEITRTAEAAADPIFGKLPASFTAFQWHSYGAMAPPGALELVPGAAGPNAFTTGSAWGIQFHPEVTAEIVGAWLDSYDTDEDAVAAGFDPEPVRERTAAEIAGSEAVGRRLAGAFVDFAQGR